MKLISIKLKNFRNYDSIDFIFNDKLNIIIGNNAQGKTNILEAIYYLSITKSFLSVNDKNCIKFSEVFSRIDSQIIYSNNIKNKLTVIINENGKKLLLNDNEIKKHSDFIGILKTIIYNPDNIKLIKDAPVNRRKFLNIEISQLYSKYINLLNEFNIILKQRNEYLKCIKIGNNNKIYFEILNEKYVNLSCDIYKYRIQFIDKINKYIGKIYKKISGYSGLYINYIPNIEVDNIELLKNNLIDKLNKNYEREILYGNTLIGPHRDDFSFNLDNNDLLLYGSQGQLKLAVLALKLAEIDVFYEVSGEYPILLLDDLFSELDVNKSNKVIKYLNKDIQIFVTTTDLNDIDKNILKQSKIFKIKNGNLIGKK